MIFLSLFYRVDQGFHTHIVVGVWFNQVDNVEPVGLILPGVGNRKVKPLRVAVSTIVVFQVKVVLCVANFNRPSQISRLKPRFENERRIRSWVF